MKIDILTLFPEICRAPLSASIMKRAQENEIVDLRIHNLRDWTTDKHHMVDDAPFGGGQGMVMKPEPIFAEVEELQKTPNAQRRTANDESKIDTRKSKIILMSPGGRRSDQQLALELSREAHLIIICGHYEGVDHRVIEHLVDVEVSIGDYVLTNGAIASAVLVDAVIRLLPGALGHEQSAADDSFSIGSLESSFCRARVVMSSRRRTIHSALVHSNRPNTHVPRIFAAGKCPRSCFREIMPRSRGGARSREKTGPKQIDPICCRTKHETHFRRVACFDRDPGRW